MSSTARSARVLLGSGSQLDSAFQLLRFLGKNACEVKASEASIMRIHAETDLDGDEGVFFNGFEEFAQEEIDEGDEIFVRLVSR